MGLKKGMTNNPNGRKKGSQNKDNAPIREKFQQLLDEYGIDQMVKDLRALSPKDRMTIISGLAEYIVPKLARTEIQAAVETKEVQTFTLGGKEITF